MMFMMFTMGMMCTGMLIISLGIERKSIDKGSLVPSTICPVSPYYKHYQDNLKKNSYLLFQIMIILTMVFAMAVPTQCSHQHCTDLTSAKPSLPSIYVSFNSDDLSNYLVIT